jgi:hypothetical protein
MNIVFRSIADSTTVFFVLFEMSHHKTCPGKGTCNSVDGVFLTVNGDNLTVNGF